MRLDIIRSIVEATPQEHEYANDLASRLDNDSRVILIVCKDVAAQKRVYNRLKNTYKRCEIILKCKEYTEIKTTFGEYILVVAGDRRALVGRKYFNIIFEDE